LARSGRCSLEEVARAAREGRLADIVERRDHARAERIEMRNTDRLIYLYRLRELYARQG
jgi:hypothetical protein